MFRFWTALFALSFLVVCLPFDLPSTGSQQGSLAFQSDDFNTAELNTDLWTFVNPLNDAAVEMVGTGTSDAWLNIGLPAGTPHDIWIEGNQAPRLMQPARNIDFQLEVKFESQLIEGYEVQGVIVEADAKTFLRFDFYTDGLFVYVFATSFSAGLPATPALIQQNITDNLFVRPLYLRVSRDGDQWTQAYSINGVEWTVAGTFTYSMVVSSVGVFAGNAGSNSPGHTASIDYFFNTAAPIEPEDNGIPSALALPTPTPVASVPLVTDTSSPLIDSMETWAGAGAARLLWITNEAAKSVVDYGTSTEDERDPIQETTFSRYHQITVTGLESETTYHFSITAQDEADNISRPKTFTVKTGIQPVAHIIDVWYGTNQVFGQVGWANRWINILGSVSVLDGSDVSSLTYSLNNGQGVRLSIGPDTRRLTQPGDFNIELAYTDLNLGENKIEIIATDSLGLQTRETVTVEIADNPEDYWVRSDLLPINPECDVVPEIFPSGYVRSSTPTTLNWAEIEQVYASAQIVDGLWALDHQTMRTLLPGYDRLVALGELSWQDYEITVPVTVYSVDPTGYDDLYGGPGVGVIVRWPGHVDWGSRPFVGWTPLGAIGWYHWIEPSGVFEMVGGPKGLRLTRDYSGRALELGSTYLFKMRVETLPSDAALYRMKFWKQGDPEPNIWILEAQLGADAPANGTMMLLAHYVDAAFGTVEITPLGQNSQPQTCKITVVRNSNVRSRPDRSAEVRAQLRPNQEIILTGQTVGPDGFIWWQLLQLP